MMARFPFLALLAALLLSGPALIFAAETVNESVAGEAGKEPVARFGRDNSFENSPLGGGSSNRVASSGRETSPWGAAARVAGGLLFLGVLAVGGVFALKRILPGGRRTLSGRAAEVLSRTSVDGRRYLALVRVGRRVLVVGVSPEGMSCLSEITEAEEVAEIMRTACPASDEGKGVFLKLLRGGMKLEDAAATSKAPGGESAELEREVEEIRTRLRGLRTGD